MPSPSAPCLQRHHLNGAYKPTDFFETAAMLITLVLMGKYLESAVSAFLLPLVASGCLEEHHQLLLAVLRSVVPWALVPMRLLAHAVTSLHLYCTVRHIVLRP